MRKIDKKEEKVIDASGRTLGRVASAAAIALSGKDRASFERHIYSGSPVRIVHASKLRISPEKLKSITHKRYSGYPGGFSEVSGPKILEKYGYSRIIEHAIYQMLPGNKLRREMMKHLMIEE